MEQQFGSVSKPSLVSLTHCLAHSKQFLHEGLTTHGNPPSCLTEKTQGSLVKASEDEVTALKISPLRFSQMTNLWPETQRIWNWNDSLCSHIFKRCSLIASDICLILALSFYWDLIVKKALLSIYFFPCWPSQFFPPLSLATYSMFLPKPADSPPHPLTGST